jgi:hypothetical protein
MSEIVIPPNGGGKGHDTAGEDPRPFEQPPTNRIPSLAQCLETLAQLSGLVALGMLKPAQANHIRGNLREILQYHYRQLGGSGAAAVADHNVLELLRQSPELMNLMTPILTDAQVAMVMKHARHNPTKPQT